MVRGRFVLHAAACVVALLVITTSAWGDVFPVSVTGTAWRVAGNWNDAPSVAPVGTPELTFRTTTGGVNFFTQSGTLQDFLSFGGFVIINASGGLNQQMSNCSTSGPTNDPACYSTVIEIDGKATFQKGVLYTLTHDDGAVMFAGGNFLTPVINSPTPTTPLPSTWAPDADYSGDFRIFYMGTNGDPEQLRLDYTVPEPASIVFLGTCLLGIASICRRRFAR